MGKPAVRIELTGEQRAELEGLVRRRRTAQGLAERVETVLLAADGLQNKETVVQLGKDANTVGKWRRRFAEHGPDRLYDEPRSGARFERKRTPDSIEGGHWIRGKAATGFDEAGHPPRKV